MTLPLATGAQKPVLGRLERVDLRKVWEVESRDFTPWLARKDNIALLGETVGLDLEVEGTEKGVGPFRADILCKETASGHYVLIENQLDLTDHTHLGQLLTYAAGLVLQFPFRIPHLASVATTRARAASSPVAQSRRGVPD